MKETGAGANVRDQPFHNPFQKAALKAAVKNSREEKKKKTSWQDLPSSSAGEDQQDLQQVHVGGGAGADAPSSRSVSLFSPLTEKGRKLFHLWNWDVEKIREGIRRPMRIRNMPKHLPEFQPDDPEEEVKIFQNAVREDPRHLDADRKWAPQIPNALDGGPLDTVDLNRERHIWPVEKEELDFFLNWMHPPKREAGQGKGWAFIPDPERARRQKQFEQRHFDEELDLQGLSAERAREITRRFLLDCFDHERRLLLIVCEVLVHTRRDLLMGARAVVDNLLRKNPERIIAGYSEAPSRFGADGGFLVLLKNRRQTPPREKF